MHDITDTTVFLQSCLKMHVSLLGGKINFFFWSHTHIHVLATCLRMCGRTPPRALWLFITTEIGCSLNCHPHYIKCNLQLATSFWPWYSPGLISEISRIQSIAYDSISLHGIKALWDIKHSSFYGKNWSGKNKYIRKNVATCASQGLGWKTDFVTTFEFSFSESLTESQS